MRSMRHAAAIALLAMLAGCGGASPTTTPPKEDTVTQPKPTGAPDFTKTNLLEGLERRSLDNGLVVLVKEDHRLPTVSTVITYRVGSVYEKDGNTGLAHFLEHMMFKGTDKYRKGEIDWRTFLAGGMNNAYTSEDMTSYWFTISSDKLDDFLALEANRMRN